MRTHQQLLYHIVFSTKNRKPTLTDSFREDVFAYMAGTCGKLEGTAIKVGGFFMSDGVEPGVGSSTASATPKGSTRALNNSALLNCLSDFISESPRNPRRSNSHQFDHLHQSEL